MNSLTTCIRKAGKAISIEDKAFLQQVRQEYLDEGIEAKKATNRAINDLLGIHEDNLSEITKDIVAAGGYSNQPEYYLSGDDVSVIYDGGSKSHSNVKEESTETDDIDSEPALYRLKEDDSVFEAPEQNTWLNNRIREIQDKYLPLKNVQEAIKKTGQVIPDEMDAYVVEELRHTKIEEDQKRVKTHVQHAVDKMVDYGLSQEEVDLYLIAKYAPNRNEMVARKFRHMDGKQLEMFPGLTREDLQDGGSGMTNAESKAILKAFQKEGTIQGLEDIASDIYAMIKDKNDQLLDSGTLSEEQHTFWTQSKTFEHYVPLKGSEAKKYGTEQEIVGTLSSSGFSIINNESMKALGRRTLSESPFTHSIQDATSAILRARSNEVGQAFLQLVYNNPNPSYWSVYDKDNLPKFERYNAKTKTNELKTLSIGEMTPVNGFIGVKVDGEQRYVKIIHDRRLLKAMTNLGPETMSKTIRFMGTATRILSSLNTSLNPEFVITNALRDPQTAIFNALAETELADGKLRGVEDKVKFVTQMANPQTIAAAIRGINSAIKGGQGKAFSKGDKLNHEHYEAYYQDFLDQGGKTGFYDMKSLEEQANDLVRMLEMSKGTLKGDLMKHTQGALAFIDRINTSVENGIRLSAYVHAVHAGMSKQKAASFAKNLTVNFNRKGEITWLNAIYMFGNASVQGTAQFVRSVGANPKKHPSGKTQLNLAQKAAVTMSAAGFLFSLLGREMGGEDEDGEMYFDKIDDYILERNIVIMKSTLGGPEDGSYWKIPLPYGYNIFHNLGTATEMLVNGSKTKKDVIWASRFLTFSTLGSFSPVSIGETNKGVVEGTIKTITPTLFKPFMEMGLDENHFGQAIFRNTAYDQSPKPNSLGKSTTHPHWKAIAMFLNDVTKTNDYKPGFIDIAPEAFEHLVESYGGGLWRLGDKTLGVTEKLTLGERLEAYQVPFYRKLTGKVNHYGNQNDFYDRKDEVAQAAEKLKSLKGQARIQFRSKYANILSLRGSAKATEKRLKLLRKRRNIIMRLNTEDKQQRLDKIAEKMQTAVNRFNLKYNKLFN